MQKTIILLLLTVLLAACGGSEQGSVSDDARLKAETRARQATMKLTGTLMGEVQSAMKAGGAPGAVRSCAEKAQALTADVAEAEGVTLRRVTSRTRNPADAPDDWEAGVLARFADMKAKDALTPDADHSEVITLEGRTVLRYMKPITIKKPCLACHGDAASIAGEVRTELEARYPADQATGYADGDLRGAVSVIVPIED